MKRRKKLYYVPGLLSLLFAPLLIYNSIINRPSHGDSRVLEIIIPDRNATLNFERNHEEIYLKGEPDAGRVKLDFIAIRAKEIVDSKDTLNAVHVILDQQSQYYEFVKLVEIATKTDITYFIKGKHFTLFIPDIKNETIQTTKDKISPAPMIAL